MFPRRPLLSPAPPHVVTLITSFFRVFHTCGGGGGGTFHPQVWNLETLTAVKRPDGSFFGGSTFSGGLREFLLFYNALFLQLTLL